MLPTAAALVVAPVAQWYRWLAAVTFATGTVVLGLSQSRGGFVAYVAAMIVLVVLVYWRRLVPRSVLVRGSVLAMIPLSLQIAVVGSRLMDFDNAAALSRLPLMRLAFAMIQENAVWGVGANNFAAALDQYVTVEYSIAWISTVHNRYLLSWAETGVIGLVALLWFLVSILRRAFAVVRRSDRLLALVAAGLLAGVLANMIHMSVDIYNSRPLVQLLWLVAGLVIAVERMSADPAARAAS
jgi:O-antigen ligase